MLSFKYKALFAFTVAVICVALMVVWYLADPLADQIVLLDVENEVDVGFNSMIPVSASIEEDIEVQLGTLQTKKDSVRAISAKKK